MIIWTKQQNFFFYVVIDLLCFYSRSLHCTAGKGRRKEKVPPLNTFLSERSFFLGGIRTFATSSSFLCSWAPNKSERRLRSSTESEYLFCTWIRLPQGSVLSIFLAPSAIFSPFLCYALKLFLALFARRSKQQNNNKINPTPHCHQKNYFQQLFPSSRARFLYAAQILQAIIIIHLMLLTALKKIPFHRQCITMSTHRNRPNKLQSTRSQTEIA